MAGLVTPTARSVAQTLRRNGFLGAHSTSRALGLLPGECFVWFERGDVASAAELLRGRGWACGLSGRGLIVEDAAEQAARGGRGADGRFRRIGDGLTLFAP